MSRKCSPVAGGKLLWKESGRRKTSCSDIHTHTHIYISIRYLYVWHLWNLTGDFSSSWRHASRKESDLSTDFLALFLLTSPEMVSPSEMHWNQSGWIARWMSMNLEAVISMRPELPHTDTACQEKIGMKVCAKNNRPVNLVKHQMLERHYRNSPEAWLK